MKKKEAHELVGFLALWAVKFQEDYPVETQCDILKPRNFPVILLI